MKPLWQVCCVFLLLAKVLSGTDLPVTFDRITIADGLTQNTVLSILEDRDGFMWFGTRFGLNRYDGSEIKTFLHEALNDNSLPGSKVTALCEDHDGVMWVGTSTGGIGKYNREQETFERFTHDSSNSNSLVSNRVTELYVDSRGFLWIGTEEGLSVYDKSKKSFKRYQHDPENDNTINQNRIMSLCEYPLGTMNVGLENGSLDEIDIQADTTLTRFLVRENSSISLRSMYADHADSVLWVGRFGHGLYKYDHKIPKISRCRTSDREQYMAQAGPNKICKDKNGLLWIAGVAGLATFDPETEIFQAYLHDRNNPSSLGDNLLYDGYIDRQGIIWLGTESDGVNYYDPALLRFANKRSEPDNPNSINANMVFSISEDMAGNIWFGTLPGGTSVKDAKTGEFTHYNSFGKGHAWSRDYVARVRSDHSQKIWIGTFECGLFVLDYPTQKMGHYRNGDEDPTSFGDKTTRDILVTRDGDVWIATESNGLDRYDQLTHDFEHFKHDPNDPQSISSNFTYRLIEDRDGMIWIGTSDRGLNKFDRESGTFSHYQVEMGSDKSLSSNYVISLYEDDSKNLWIGTRNGGLNKMNPERTRVSPVDLEARPQGQTIFGILEDDHHFLWLSTNKGILKVHPDSGLVNTYTVSDGAQEEFYFASCVKARDGRMYFGGINGYNVFHPDSIKNNTFIPPIVFTGLSINYEPVSIGPDEKGRTILHKSISKTDIIHLNYYDKVISFKFAALNFSASYKNKYSYRLEGYDSDWRDAQYTPIAQYMNLPAGDYTFRVRGSNNDGLWNLEGASIKLSISPPFWKTWWFRILLVIILISALLLYIQLRIARLIAQREELEKLVRERTAQLKEEIEERQRVELEKTELKLDHLKRELLTQSLHLNDKQQIMDNLQKELEGFSKVKNSEVRPRINKLLRFLRDRSAVKQGWHEFEQWFTEIHTGFYTDLRSDYPSLSESELKVCALLRLNLISKDIAKVMNVQASSIDIYRHRIRKKLELTGEDNLAMFLSKY